MAEYLEPYYQIGEVAQISGVSILTLRYYDKIDLLKPAYIDNESKYRYYSQRQIYFLSMIKEFKNLGFKLSDIKELLNRDSNHMYKLLSDYTKNIDKQILKLQNTKRQILDRIKPFELVKTNSEPISNNDQFFEVKHIPARKIVSIRKSSKSSYIDMVQRFLELRQLMEKLKLTFTSYYFSIFHGDYLTDENSFSDIEVCSLYDEKDKIESEHLRKIPEGWYLTNYCRGDHEQTKKAYTELLKYLRDNDLSVKKPVIKVYHISYLHTSSANRLVSEIQISVD